MKTLLVLSSVSAAASLLLHKQGSRVNSSRRELRIMMVSEQYSNLRTYEGMESCPEPCGQASSMDDADVIFAYSHVTVPRRVRPEQVWVGTFWESPQHYPAMSIDYDYTFSWRSDATFPKYDMIPDTMADIYDQNLRFVRKDSAWPRRTSFEQKAKNPQKIALWISNCGIDETHRLKMAEELDREGLRFASYGGCLHNAQSDAEMGRFNFLQEERHSQSIRTFLFRSHSQPAPRDADEYRTSSKHLFFYAAENSNCAYYHTEKVYRGLLSGSIPIYNGNPKTIDGFVPKGSIIKTSDFPSTKALAQYLLRVASNKTLYNSYFNWWKEDLLQTNPSLRQKLLTRRPAATPEEQQHKNCDMCTYLHHHGRNVLGQSKALGCEV